MQEERLRRAAMPPTIRVPDAAGPFLLTTGKIQEDGGIAATRLSS
jgi:hypothetical protein